MVASAALRGLLLAGLLAAVCGGQAPQEAPVEDFGVEAGPSADRDLFRKPTQATRDGAEITQIDLSTVTVVSKLMEMIFSSVSF